MKEPIDVRFGIARCKSVASSDPRLVDTVATSLKTIHNRFCREYCGEPQNILQCENEETP